MGASIIIVTFNSEPYLAACIDSLLPQLASGDEIIVVDNGSSDGSAALVQQRYPSVRFVHNANTGYAGGNNLGAEHATGDVLVFLNPDTVAHPGAIAALLAPLGQGGDVALTTACITHLHQPDVINTCGNTLHYSGLAYCRGAGQPRAAYTESALVDAVSGAAFAIRRSVFQELGGFDETFFMYVEDTDLSLRARLAGYRCFYVAQAVVQHDYQPKYTPQKAYYLDRNRHLMLLKNLSRSTYLRMLPGLLVAEILTWGFLLIKGPEFWPVKSAVYRWLWQHRREIREARQQQQALCRRPDQAVMHSMTYQLEFHQFASSLLAKCAELCFHPVFWVARLLFAGARS